MKKIKSIFALALIAITLLCCKKNMETSPGGGTPPEVHIPTADFSVSATSGDAPISINFTNKSSSSAISWLWDFGDGSTSAEKNPSHTFTKLGRYTVSLTVTNTDGSNSKVLSNAVTVYEIQTKISSTFGPFYPGRTLGDYEFDGHGPSVNATANLVIDRSGSNETLKLKLTMSAKETVSDWSTAYGEWYINIASIPTNATIKDFLSPTGYSQSYIDGGHGYVYTNNSLLGEIWTMGDTDGDDICSGGCNTGDTHLYFKKFYCQYRIQPK